MSDRPLGLWWVLAAGLAVGLVLVAQGHLLHGGYVMAGALALAALLRLVLPRSAAGSLAVRSRGTDVVVLLVLAGVLAGVLTVLDMRPRGPGSVNGLAAGIAKGAAAWTGDDGAGAPPSPSRLAEAPVEGRR